MNTLEKNPASDIFQPAWLAFLVSDYMVSPWWLLVGEGDFFQYGWDAEKVKNLQKTCKSGK